MIQSMNEILDIWLPDAEKTVSCGTSLARSLYHVPLTVLCAGDLGTGKTAFIQGFARGSTVCAPVTSPTFALERRYQTADGTPFLHLDLYRLSDADARSLITTTDEAGGIRCIEWGDRIPRDTIHGPAITVAFEEEHAGRRATITFDDVPLPPQETILAWRRIVHLPAHIAAHCDAVAHVAGRLADSLLTDGIIVRRKAVARAALVHDLFRFIDFQDGAAPEDASSIAENEDIWNSWKETWKGLRHEEACARFLAGEGYPELARIVAVHGLMLPSPKRTTTEQKLLYYADKRVRGGTTVSLQERFEDFQARYSGGRGTVEGRLWYEEAQQVESALFPLGTPPL